MEISLNGTVLFYFSKPEMDAICISNFGTLFGFSWGWEYWRQAAPVAFSRTVTGSGRANKTLHLEFGRSKIYFCSEW